MAKIRHRLMPKLFRVFFPKRFTAITLSKSLCLYRTEEHLNTPRLIAHESCHAEQYARYGYFGFIVRYLYYTCRHGYWENPLEREARKAEEG